VAASGGYGTENAGNDGNDDQNIKRTATMRTIPVSQVRAIWNMGVALIARMFLMSLNY
jgi:hypothetical protein